jgi:multidrug efflux system membrane fusion protein
MVIGCVKPPVNRGESPPVAVTVAHAKKMTVPIQVRTIGTVKAAATVAIRPRVGGQLIEVFFKEGESVKKDQKLLKIDPRPYQATVKQAEATLSRSQAILAGKELDLKRIDQVGSSVVSAVELDAARTAVATALAAVNVDQAALESAKLQLSFTTILSPLDGRVGELLVNEGNLVEPNSLLPLVVINQVSPIFVTFALPETQLPAVTLARRQGPLKVEVNLRDGEPPIPGVLSFIDNAVNTGSGTVQLKAEFTNRDQKLLPGQFVDTVLTVRDQPNCVVVPASAVQSGQKGSYVFVVVGDGTVRFQSVTVGFETGSIAVIDSGLNGNETVVTEGQLRLMDGSKVDVKSMRKSSGEPTE